jgi:hypothetical protein
MFLYRHTKGRNLFAAYVGCFYVFNPTIVKYEPTTTPSLLLQRPYPELSQPSWEFAQLGLFPAGNFTFPSWDFSRLGISLFPVGTFLSWKITFPSGDFSQLGISLIPVGIFPGWEFHFSQ